MHYVVVPTDGSLAARKSVDLVALRGYAELTRPELYYQRLSGIPFSDLHSIAQTYGVVVYQTILETNESVTPVYQVRGRTEYTRFTRATWLSGERTYPELVARHSRFMAQPR